MREKSSFPLKDRDFKVRHVCSFNPLPPSDAVRQQKYFFTGSFQFTIATIKKISPLSKPEIYLYRHFQKLKIAHFDVVVFFNFS